MGMFSRKTEIKPDGTKVIDTKRKTVTKYPNGELDVHRKKTGETTRFRYTEDES